MVARTAPIGFVVVVQRDSTKKCAAHLLRSQCVERDCVCNMCSQALEHVAPRVINSTVRLTLSSTLIWSVCSTRSGVFGSSKAAVTTGSFAILLRRRSRRDRKIETSSRRFVKMNKGVFLTESSAWNEVKCPIAVAIRPGCFDRGTGRPLTTIFRQQRRPSAGWRWWKSSHDGAGR